MPQRTNDALIATLNMNRAAVYKTVLLELGYEVHVARDGEEAQQLIARYGVPQLVITDVSLPRTDGISLIRHLRREVPKDRMGAIVIAAHEPLRAMARQLVDSLGITRVLPADSDRGAMREAIQAALPGTSAKSGRPARSEQPVAKARRTDDPLSRAALEGARRFRVPVCVAYLKAEGREHLAAHVSLEAPSGASIELPGVSVLRQIASAGEPLILPDIETHPPGRELALPGSGAVRGLAGVPFEFEHLDAAGALCLLDTRPLSLDAGDLDDLIAFARDLVHGLDPQLEPEPLPASAAEPELNMDDLQTLERLAVTDPLTGLANRRGGEQNIATEISRARRQKSALSCILLDIDRFKDVNDTYGHPAGDQVLREISGLLRRTVRAYDVLVRWGGEEFLVVLPGVDLEQARRLAERVRRAVEALETPNIGPITVSAGAATIDSDYDFDGMLSQADRRLYQAKAAGRNCIA